MTARLFCVAVLAAWAGAAPALTLDFGNVAPGPAICSSTADGLGSAVACGNNAYLLQSYGDVAGVSDISYSAPRVPGVSLRWWDEFYNTLYGVAWADGTDADSMARIEIQAVQPGASVTLSAFDLGAYPYTNRFTSVAVYAIGGGPALYSFAGVVGQTVDAPTHFNLNVSAVGGLWIEWRDSAYNVGIDNIQYSVSAVPEPGAAWLLLAGGAALLARRRR